MMDFADLDLPGAPLRLHTVWVDYEGPKVFALQSIDYGFFYIVNAVAAGGGDDDEWMTFLAAPQAVERFIRIAGGVDSFRSAFTEPAGGRLYEVTWRWANDGWWPEVQQMLAGEVRKQWLPAADVFLHAGSEVAQDVPAYHRRELLELTRKQNRTTFAVKVAPPNVAASEFPALYSGRLQVAVQRQLDALAAEQGGGYSARHDVQASVTGQRAASYVVIFAIDKGPQSLVERTDLTDRVFSDLRELLMGARDHAALMDVLERHTVRTRLRFADLLRPLVDTHSAMRFDTSMLTSNEVQSVEVSAEDLMLALEVLEHPDKTVSLLELNRATLLGADVRTSTFDIFDDASAQTYTGSMTEEAKAQVDGLSIGEHSYVTAIIRVERKFGEDAHTGLSFVLEQVETREVERE